MTLETGKPTGFPILDRTTPSKDVQAQDTKRFAEHVVTELGGEFTPNAQEVASEHILQGSRSNGRDLLERIQLIPQLKTLDLTVHDGCRILGTPYDREWQAGSGGFAFGGRHDGKFSTVSAEGNSAAGVGFYLSSSDRIDVSVSPSGNYQFSSLAASDTPRLLSQGGLGITVYANNEGAPALSRQARLWDLRGDIRHGKPFGGVSGEGTLASAASPAPPGMFRFPLGPISVSLRPGDRYLIWVWNWQICRNSEGFVAFLNARMPAVTVCGGPPVVIR